MFYLFLLPSYCFSLFFASSNFHFFKIARYYVETENAHSSKTGMKQDMKKIKTNPFFCKNNPIIF
ncbi:MAG TPA: hypothetical protein DDZ69_07150, partial [Porphyromonadaceae bacterium]|nr:hypothetical protein [Porphyromonadaceae bacterium]